MHRPAVEYNTTDDPFATPEPAPPNFMPPSLLPPPLPPPFPPGQKSFGQVIQAMGSLPPVDARAFLRDIGVELKDGDLALFAPHRELLFVRSNPDQLDIVAALMEGGFHFAKNVEITITVRRVLADQSREDIIIRTLTCRAGQRAKFERHRAGNLMEKQEVEVTVGEDGRTIDLYADLESHFEDHVIKVSAQDLLRSGDAAGHVLHTARGKPSGGSLEVVASAVIRPSPGDPTNLEKLAQTIDAQIRNAPGLPVPARRSELFYVPYLPGYLKPDGPAAAFHGAALAGMGPGGIIDLRGQLQSLKVPLADEDLALYAPASALLFLRAGEDAQRMITRVADEGKSSVKQTDVSLISWVEQPAEAAPRYFAPRSLLVRGGQKSTGSMQYPRGSTEKMEIEATMSEGNAATADLNLSLKSFRMGGGTWTVSTQTTVSTDGESLVTLVSGRAKDSGGEMKHLTVSSTLRHNQWLDTVLDPKRKQAAIAEIEAALKK